MNECVLEWVGHRDLPLPPEDLEKMCLAQCQVGPSITAPIFRMYLALIPVSSGVKVDDYVALKFFNSIFFLIINRHMVSRLKHCYSRLGYASHYI